MAADKEIGDVGCEEHVGDRGYTQTIDKGSQPEARASNVIPPAPVDTGGRAS